MQQIGIDICSLPEVDIFKQNPFKINVLHHCSVPLLDYMFVNKVSKALLSMIGNEQQITLAYHSKSSGLCKQQNKTIKDSLVNGILVIYLLIYHTLQILGEYKNKMVVHIGVKNNIWKSKLASFWIYKIKQIEVTGILDYLLRDLISNFSKKLMHE